MIYDHKHLNQQEVIQVEALLQHYKGYDRLDIIVELAVNNPADILLREPKNKKIEKIASEPMPNVLYNGKL